MWAFLIICTCPPPVDVCAGGVQLAPSALDLGAPAQLAAWAAAPLVEAAAAALVAAALEQAQAQRPRGWGLGQHGMSSRALERAFSAAICWSMHAQL